MLRICKYLSQSEIGQLLIGLIFIVSQIWFDLKLPDYMSDITQLVETPGSNMRDIWIAGGKMLLISLGSVLCAIATGYVAARVGASFSQRLRSLEFRKVESFGPAEMNRFSTASLITRSTNDITQIQMFVTMGLLLLVKSPIMAVWAVCKIAGKGVDWTVATAVAVARAARGHRRDHGYGRAQIPQHAAADRQYQPRRPREPDRPARRARLQRGRTIRRRSMTRPMQGAQQHLPVHQPLHVGHDAA
jgi:ABC-type multidrug transport system fused ATPase/permease subunit